MKNVVIQARPNYWVVILNLSDFMDQSPPSTHGFSEVSDIIISKELDSCRRCNDYRHHHPEFGEPYFHKEDKKSKEKRNTKSNLDVAATCFDTSQGDLKNCNLADLAGSKSTNGVVEQKTTALLKRTSFVGLSSERSLLEELLLEHLVHNREHQTLKPITSDPRL